MHAGNTRAHLVAAEVAVAERALARLGQPIATDPIDGLQRAVDSAAGLHAGLQQLVREAADSEDTRQLLARLALYSDAIDRLARVAKSAVDARLTDRQAALSLAQAELLSVLVTEALRRAGMAEQVAAVRHALAAEIRHRKALGTLEGASQ